ncbi:hypothetical protein LX64_02307 [Chitinophaga skermanii]|uniref:Glycosyl-4,4'-diaponeurosporenoate acyltransferase n=1 Tax=Chitinophaga skermanii TaxID=331697 RepID=A0A327QP78_9BACT|nr:hypothetical protein [Chitinophaga skermanii]RAJ05153.1 hypothetical protein LX64_02307 [Chitinophaga skermanii]
MKRARPTKKDYIEARKLAAVYNMVPNLVWSILHLTPVVVYSWNEIEPFKIYILLGISVLLGILPAGFYNWMQFSKTTAAYKKVGILMIRKYSQDGDLIIQQVRKKYPFYKVVESRDAIIRYIGRTYVYERFHFMVLMYMLMVLGVTLYRQAFVWAIVLLLNNVCYNFYPLLLQQYNRLRLITLLKRSRP